GRQLFAQLPDSKVRGYQHKRFSFNKPGGRCEACEGNGQKKIEMHFLPDVWVECDVCRGKRYNPETLAVTYKGKSIADVLDMRVSEALELFANIPKIRRVLQTLADVGLDYVALGQPAPTLSGGEVLKPILAAGPHVARARFDPAAAEATTDADLDLDDVGKDAQLPWEADGKRWHTESRITAKGKPSRWEGAILPWLESEIRKL